jgi:hypothetical protein
MTDRPWDSLTWQLGRGLRSRWDPPVDHRLFDGTPERADDGFRSEELRRRIDDLPRPVREVAEAVGWQNITNTQTLASRTGWPKWVVRLAMLVLRRELAEWAAA